MWEAFVPAAVSAGANLLGGSMSAAGAASNNAQNMANSWGMWNAQRDFAFQQSRDQMEFQREMSNTAYQRATADMKAAGLNPILAYAQGGASSPPGAGQTASGSMATMENTEQEKGRSIGMAATSAMSAAKSVAEIQNATETNKLIREQQANTAADAKLKDANTLKALSETDLTKGQIQNLPQILKLLVGQTDAAHASSIASHAAAGASSAYAANQSAQTKQLQEAGKGHAASEVQGLWRLIQSGIPTPSPSTARAPKNRDIPGARSLWDIIKENLP